MLTTKPISHNRVALLVDGYVVFIGSAEVIRRMIGV